MRECRVYSTDYDMGGGGLCCWRLLHRHTRRALAVPGQTHTGTRMDSQPQSELRRWKGSSKEGIEVTAPASRSTWH